MKRLAWITTLVLLMAPLLRADEPKRAKVMIFPLKVISQEGPETFSTELAGVLGAELTREGDLDVASGAPFISAVQEKKVDPARLVRLADRMGAGAVVWGRVSKIEDGYSMEVWVAESDPRKKPRLFSATGKSMEDLIGKVKELAVEVGTAALKSSKLGEIKIEGNKRVQREAILNKLDVKAGSPFRRSALADEIREIYSMGYFDDVQIRAEETADGQVDLHISLSERPSLKSIEIEGSKLFTKDEILDAITTKSFSVASAEKIRNDIDKVKQMYEKKGYYKPKIDYDIKELSRNEATLTFKIDEGQKSYLTEVVFEGAKKLSPDELRKAMSVKEKSWVWFLDDSGTFTMDKLDENRMRLFAYYLDNGFINVQVGAPDVKIEGPSVKVTYPIREGERYQVRKVDVAGDLIIPHDQLLEKLQTQPKTWFKRSSVAEDIKALTKLYNDQGFAYADVEPQQKINDENKFLDLTYRVSKGQRVTIERVDVVGNERTRDKVIRRGLAIGEGDLYSSGKFEATKGNLESMDFFEAVKLKTAPGSRPDLMNVTVEVMEKKTGSLAAGLGYSSQDGAMGNIDLKERNMFGLGVVANAKASLSGRRNNYEGSLSYPWMFDYPVTGSLRGYKAVQKENYYVRDSDGFSVHLGYPLYGLWTMSTGFARDSSKLGHFDQGFSRSVADYYRSRGMVGDKFLNLSENSISVNFGRDTRDNSVIPTGGTKVSVGGRFSGLGADVAFSSYYSEAIYYKTLFWKAILKFRTNGSLLMETGNEPIPFDRRIVLGGIQSIRGYRHGEIGPRDRFGNIIGGDRSLYSNLECLFPVIEQLKINGVVFFDAGNAWNVSDGPMFKEIKAGFGAGIRWVSPMGPIRMEYGWKISPQKGEETGAFAFAMGQLF